MQEDQHQIQRNENHAENRNDNIRKARKTLTPTMLEQIISMRDRGYSVVEMANIEGLSKWAVYKILDKIGYAEENGIEKMTIINQKGRKRSDRTREVQAVAEVVQFENTLTQQGMKEKLAENEIRVSQSKVSRLLKEAELTRKRLKLRPTITQSSEHLEKRKCYAREIRVLRDEVLIFLDETGFNLHSGAKYGYSPKNTDAIRLVPANRGRNVSLMACIGVSGVIHHKAICGSFTGDTMTNFLREARAAIRAYSFNAVVVMDNASIHHSAVVKEFSVSNGIRIHYLPPYCPQLNPIEEFFSSLKARFAQVRCRINTADEIKTALDEIISVMQGEVQFSNFYSNMRRYLDDAFNGLWF